MQGDKASIFTEAQETELRRVKQYFPYRIVWGAIGPNGEFESGANTTRRELNKYLRKGWLVATIGG